MRDGSTDIHRAIIEHSGRHLSVLGPPASGKTSLLMERFRHLVSKGIETAVIAYTREHCDRLTAGLLRPDAARFGRIPVYTYHTLSREIMRAGGAGAVRVIDEMEESVLLRRVLRSTKDRFSSDYRRTVESAAFQRTILDALHVLFQNGVDQERCEALIRSSHAPRLRDLFLLYAEYRRHLRSHGFVTYYDEPWRAAELVADRTNLGPFAGVGALLVDDFQDIDPGQYALIRAAAPPDGGTRVEAFGDPSGARFGDRGTTDQFLTEVFPRHYRADVVRLPAWRGNDRDLGPVVDALLGETLGESGARLHAGASPLTGDEVEVSLDVAEDEVAEASLVAEAAAALIAAGKYRADDIVVAVRDKRDYEAVLSRAFRDHGLILETGRSRNPAVAYLVASLLRYVDAPGSEAARNAVTHSPFFAELRGTFEAVTGRDAGSEPDRAVEVIRTEIKRSLERGNGVLDLEPFLTRWLRPVLGAIAPQETPPELLGFLGRLVDEWRTYAGIVDDTKGRRTLSEFLSVSRALAGDAANGQKAGRVGLYTCRELSSKRFDVVFVIGCSELLFPALPSREKYVPYGVLQETLRSVVTDTPVEIHPARSDEQFLKDEYALMLTALTRADGALHLSAPKQHGGRSCPAPARALSGVPADRVTREIRRSPAPFVRFAEAIARSRDVPAATGHRLSDLWNRRAGEQRVIQPASGRRLSPSAIQTFTICPRKFFYNRMLRVEEERAPAMAFGTLFHELMKLLAQDHRTHAALRGVIESDRLSRFVDEAIGNSEEFAGAGEIVRSAARYHLRDMASRFVELDSARRDDYEILQVEETVEFDRGGRHFGGRTDRLDKGSVGARVLVDYKTGGGVNKRGDTVRKKALPGFDDPEERLWQIPLYCRGARPHGGEDPVLFCYYVIQPGGDSYVAGLYIRETEDTPAMVFDESMAKSFSHLTPIELEGCLDEAVGVAEEISAARTEYPRTAERERCSRCFFQRVCERTV